MTKRSTRELYMREILSVLSKYEEASVPLIISELKKRFRHKYPVNKGRISAFLQGLKKKGLVEYEYNRGSKRKPSVWRLSKEFKTKHIHNNE